MTTIGKVINVALLPLSALVWGYDKIAAWLEPKLAERLSNVPESNIITPPIHIAGPTIEAMRFIGNNEILRDMYANLLSSCMNSATMSHSHPRFVDIIRNLTPDEARILKYLCENNITQVHRITIKRRTKEYKNYILVDKRKKLLKGEILFDNFENILLYLIRAC